MRSKAAEEETQTNGRTDQQTEAGDRRKGWPPQEGAAVADGADRGEVTANFAAGREMVTAGATRDAADGTDAGAAGRAGPTADRDGGEAVDFVVGATESGRGPAAGTFTDVDVDTGGLPATGTARDPDTNVEAGATAPSFSGRRMTVRSRWIRRPLLTLHACDAHVPRMTARDHMMYLHRSPPRCRRSTYAPFLLMC